MATEKRRKELFNHTIRRIKERYGIQFCELDYSRMGNSIINQNSIFIDRRTSGASRHLIEYEGLLMFVVWNIKQKCITTALPISDIHYAMAAANKKEEERARFRAIETENYNKILHSIGN